MLGPDRGSHLKLLAEHAEGIERWLIDAASVREAQPDFVANNYPDLDELEAWYMEITT